MKKFAPKYFFIYIIRFYSFFISPFFPSSCRYSPSCSFFAVKAIDKFGVFWGGWLTLRRLFRCHPFGGYAGFDPVP